MQTVVAAMFMARGLEVRLLLFTWSVLWTTFCFSFLLVVRCQMLLVGTACPAALVFCSVVLLVGTISGGLPKKYRALHE